MVLKSGMRSRAAANTCQTKLAVGQPGDRFEREADAVAERLVSSAEPGIQAKCSKCAEEDRVQKQGMEEEEEMLQTRPMEEEEESVQMQPQLQLSPLQAGESSASPWVQSQISGSRGGGHTLDRNTRSFMESRMNSDFSKVNIHTGSEAVQMNRELGARAFTVGSDIYFNKGEYQPASTEGKKLLAHELTHTLQQGATESIQRDEEEGCDRSAITDPRRAAAIRTQVVYHHLTGVHPTLGEQQKRQAMRTARRLIRPTLQWEQTRDIVWEMVGELNSDDKIVCGPERDECSSWDAYVVGNRAPIHLCNSWFGLSDEQKKRTLIHEAAHAAGIGEPEREQYLPIWDCESGANDFHSADAWAHFIHCDSGQTPDEPETVEGDTE